MELQSSPLLVVLTENLPYLPIPPIYLHVVLILLFDFMVFSTPKEVAVHLQVNNNTYSIVVSSFSLTEPIFSEFSSNVARTGETPAAWI